MAKPSKRNSNQGQKVDKSKKSRAKAFANWTIVKADGSEIRCDRGFPLFQNPEYPSKKEDLLIEMAQAMGGTLEIGMKMTIRMNTEPEKIDANEALAGIFGVVPAAA